MPYTTKAIVGAKTKTEYEDFTTPDTWHELITVVELPEIGDSVEPLNATPLYATDHVFIDGDKKEPDDLEFSLQDIPGNAEHAAFVDRAKGFGTTTIKVTYPTGRVIEFDAQLLGWKLNPPNRGDECTVAITLKRTGGITETEAA